MRGENAPWLMAKIVAMLVYLFMFVPMLVTIALSFNSSQFGGFPIVGFSLRWYEQLFNNEAVQSALKTSVILGVSAAAICTAIGIPAALALVRYEFKAKDRLNTLILMPILIPETVLAVGLLLFLRWLGVPRNGLLLLLGHVVICLPYVVLVLQARLVGIRRVYEEAALTLGATRFRAFLAVTAPLLAPAIGAGFLLAFTVSFDNLTATYFWLPSDTQTLPTHIYSMLRTAISPEVNALGALMMMTTLGIPLIAGITIKLLSRR